MKRLFFTHAAGILASIGFVVGIIWAVVGAILAAPTPGGSAAAIANGIYMVLCSVALGTLAEISLSLRQRSTRGRKSQTIDTSGDSPQNGESL